MVVALSTAQAAEPEQVTLGCIGTVTNGVDDKSKPFSAVIIVYFRWGNVEGLGIRPPITLKDATTIVFYEEVDTGRGWILETMGNISRLTGAS